MKNLTLLGKEYEVRPASGCQGCLCDGDNGDPEAGDFGELCRAAPCIESAKGNDGRGSFIIIEEIQ